MLVAYVVASVFEESTVLCIGKSAALHPEKLQRARFVADLLGMLHSVSKCSQLAAFTSANMTELCFTLPKILVLPVKEEVSLSLMFTMPCRLGSVGAGCEDRPAAGQPPAGQG